MLSQLQKEMLSMTTFDIDGWCSQRGREAAADLHRRGLVTMRVGGSDEAQYTYLRYTITEAGRETLRSPL